jgi:hypothetical protein
MDQVAADRDTSTPRDDAAIRFTSGAFMAISPAEIIVGGRFRQPVQPV